MPSVTPVNKQKRASRARATKAQRDQRGRFLASYDRLSLYTIVRDVALAAVRAFGGEATTVTVREWNAARKHVRSTWGKVPQAHEVCRQLHDRDGAAFKWRELLVAVFHPSKTIANIDMERLTVIDSPVSRHGARHALWRVATGRTTITIDRYTADRQQHLDDAETRDLREAHALRACLPTASQIYWAYDRDWNAALVDAGLTAGPGRVGGAAGAKGASPRDAYILFALDHRREPETRTELVDWARTHVSISGVDALSWRDWQKLASERMDEFGIDPREPDEDAVTRFRTALGPVPEPAKQQYERIEVIASARRFREWLRGRSASDQLWRRFASEHNSEPTLGTLKRHGGLPHTLAEAARPDWELRAIKWEEKRQQETQRAKHQREKTRQQKREAKRNPTAQAGASDRALEALDLLRATSPLAPRELARQLDVTRVRASQILSELCRHNLARRTHPIKGHPTQSYRLTRSGAAKAAARSRASDSPL